jgi:hypothetical protein
MPISHFTAFYPSRPFWAVSKIDFSDPNSLKNFHALMSEEVFQDASEAFSVKISRDGRIMLRIEALENDDVQTEAPTDIESTVRKWGEYLDYLNAFYLLLDSSVIKLMNLSYFNLHEITNRDAFRVRYENGKHAGENIAYESIASVFQMGRFSSSYGSMPIPCEPRIIMRQVISHDAIAYAVENFRVVMSNPGLEKVLASFTKSISEYKVGNYETSIILAWFISETIISKLWKNHIESLNEEVTDGQQRINRERKDYLIGRDFHISLVSNILELWGILPFSLFKDVDTVRRFRNKIVHGASKYAPSATEAQLAINTALELSRRSNAIDFITNLSYSVTGL